MDVVAYVAKVALCAVLLVAGGAKAADISGFATTVRLFLPRRRRVLGRLPRRIATATAAAEIAVGIASISAPGVAWLNAVVLVFASAFLAISGAGYAFYRNRSCRCFGALSRRRFDRSAVVRGAVLAALAVVVVVHQGRPELGVSNQSLLGIAGALLAFVAYAGARALSVVRQSYPELALQ